MRLRAAKLNAVGNVRRGGTEPPAGPGPRLWTPLDLGTSLVLWLDAKDEASIALNGSTVSQWSDKSPMGNHVFNAVASTQPLYLPSGWNGSPTILFTRLGQEFLFNPAMSNFEANNDFTLAAAFEFLEINNTWDMIAGWRTAANTGSISVGVGAPLLQVLATFSQIGYHNTGASAASIKVDLTTRLGKKIATISRSGGTNGNGGASTVTSTGFSQATYDTNATQAWDSQAVIGFQVGGRQQQTATSYGDKYISEIVGCNTRLSTDNRQRLESYLAWEAGVQADLPVNHPYRNTRPTV